MDIGFSTHHDQQALRDRELIRVDFPDERVGITAALRRAFAAAACEDSTRDFDKLLNELN